MKTRIYLLSSVLFGAFLFASFFSICWADIGLASKLSGRILLQVEDHGKAWYVSPDKNNYRIYLGRPADAFKIMTKLGAGIKSSTLDQYLKAGLFPKKLSGKILLDVERNGEAYYINPIDLKGYYLGRPDDAFKIMKTLSLGINNNDIANIDVFSFSDDLKIEENCNIQIVTNKVNPMKYFSAIIKASASLDNCKQLKIKERGFLYQYTFSPNLLLNPNLNNYYKKVISLDDSDYFSADIVGMIPGSYSFVRSYIIDNNNNVFYGNSERISGENNSPLPLNSFSFFGNYDNNIENNNSVYQIKYSSGENGYLLGEEKQLINFGLNGTPIEAIADYNYHFLKWSDNIFDNPRIDSNVTKNIDVLAEFDYGLNKNGNFETNIISIPEVVEASSYHSDSGLMGWNFVNGEESYLEIEDNLNNVYEGGYSVVFKDFYENDFSYLVSDEIKVDSSVFQFSINAKKNETLEEKFLYIQVSSPDGYSCYSNTLLEWGNCETHSQPMEVELSSSFNNYLFSDIATPIGSSIILNITTNNNSELNSAQVWVDDIFVINDAPKISFIVDSLLDDIDDSIGDGICATSEGDCTFRAAIMESNVAKDNAIIDINFASEIDGTCLIDPYLGEISLTHDNVSIIGPGTDKFIIDGDENYGVGLTIWSDNNSISGFSVRGFTAVNVYLIGSDYNEIFNMDISYAGHYGQANLEIFSSSNNIIRDSNFVDGRIGLRILDNSSFNEAYHNSFDSNFHSSMTIGWGSHNNHYWENTITNAGQTGMYIITGAYDNIIEKNILTDGVDTGIILLDSSIPENGLYFNTNNNYIVDNEISGFVNGIGINQGADYNFIQGNDLHDNINGLDIGYMGIPWQDPSDYCDNNSIINNNIYNNTEKGISLKLTSYNNITNNVIYNNEIGISVVDESENNVINLNFIYNNSDTGVSVIESDLSEIISNKIYNNTYYQVEITESNFFSLDNNEIYNNLAPGDGIGVNLRGGTEYSILNNIIHDLQMGISSNISDNGQVNNNVLYNNLVGLLLFASSNMSINSNNFYNNNIESWMASDSALSYNSQDYNDNVIYGFGREGSDITMLPLNGSLEYIASSSGGFDAVLFSFYDEWDEVTYYYTNFVAHGQYSDLNSWDMAIKNYYDSSAVAVALIKNILVKNNDVWEYNGLSNIETLNAEDEVLLVDVEPNISKGHNPLNSAITFFESGNNSLGFNEFNNNYLGLIFYGANSQNNYVSSGSILSDFYDIMVVDCGLNYLSDISYLTIPGAPSIFGSTPENIIY